VEQAKPEPAFPVGFDEDALAEDLECLSEGAEDALDAFRKDLRREGGLPQSRLKACHDEGQDGKLISLNHPSTSHAGNVAASLEQLRASLSKTPLASPRPT
jgi:hypothetical protein